MCILIYIYINCSFVSFFLYFCMFRWITVQNQPKPNKQIKRFFFEMYKKVSLRNVNEWTTKKSKQEAMCFTLLSRTEKKNEDEH